MSIYYLPIDFVNSKLDIQKMKYFCIVTNYSKKKTIKQVVFRRRSEVTRMSIIHIMWKEIRIM